MRDIWYRLLGLAGLLGIVYTWVLWGQFLFSLNSVTTWIEVAIGLVVTVFWFVGELVLSLLGGAVCGALVFTN